MFCRGTPQGCKHRFPLVPPADGLHVGWPASAGLCDLERAAERERRDLRPVRVRFDGQVVLEIERESVIRVGKGFGPSLSSTLMPRLAQLYSQAAGGDLAHTPRKRQVESKRDDEER